MKKIAFIGLGSMGFPMAKNLVTAGHEVYITKHSDKQISIDRVNELIALGGKYKPNLLELVKGVDVIISILPEDNEVREVYMNREVLNAIKVNTIIIDMTSCSANVIIELENYYSKKGVRVLDAPVSGGVTGAQKGTLTIFGAGDKVVFKEAEEVLKCMGERINYVGSLGKGKVLKSINNMMSAINTIGVIEGITVARVNGINLEMMQDVIMHSSGSSNSLEKKFDKIKNNDYEPNFRLSLMRKDVKIAIDAAEGSVLPLAELVFNLFNKASDSDELDFTSISRLYKK